MAAATIHGRRDHTAPSTSGLLQEILGGLHIPVQEDPADALLHRGDLASRALAHDAALHILTERAHQQDQACKNAEFEQGASLAETHFASQTLAQCGGYSDQHQSPKPVGHSYNIYKQLRGRECGRRPLNEAKQVMAATRYIPTTCAGYVAKADAKFFVGQFSPSGDTYMAACQDCTIRLFDTETWNIKQVVEARGTGRWGFRPLDVSYSPDQRWLVYSSRTGPHAYLCSINDDWNTHEDLVLNPDTSGIFSVNFSPCSTEVLAGASDCNVYIYDLNRRERVEKVQCHTGDVNTTTYNDQSANTFCSGSDDREIRVWDRRCLTTRPVGTFVGHRHGVVHISTNDAGNYLISNSKDQSIKLWDMRMYSLGDLASTIGDRHAQSLGEEYNQTAAMEVEAPSNPFDAAPSTAQWTSVGGSVESESCHKSGCIMTYRGHKVRETLVRCHFSPIATTGERYIVTGSYDGKVVMFDSLTGEITNVLRGHRGCVRDVSWHPTKPILCAASWDHTVSRWDCSPAIEENPDVMDMDYRS
eukprot:GFYU01002095.1.p1 GENE.GFYU01002095.1~~GFYU01002095.1.p1  ORF type:complete len:530 (-),score=78.93 GFYU01002095.1:219-1808(-)